MALTQTGLTLEEFLRLPEQEPALEYFNGVVTQKVSPMGEHSALQAECVLFFDRLFREARVARAFPELRETHDGASLVPDVSVYRWERIPRTRQGRIANRFTSPADVAVEILSPGQRVRGQTERCEWFIAHGARVALLIDPRRETIRVFRPGQPTRVYRAGEQVGLDEIVPGAELDVAAIFAALQID
jgi:Uma2 family endonuclease